MESERLFFGRKTIDSSMAADSMSRIFVSRERARSLSCEARSLTRGCAQSIFLKVSAMSSSPRRTWSVKPIIVAAAQRVQALVATDPGDGQGPLRR
jgi:hypothetical protein